MNENIFTQTMAMLQAYFGVKLENRVQTMYWNILQDMSDEQFKQAVTGILKSWHPTSTVPFPLVVDFRDAAGLSGKASAIHAIQILKEAIIKAGPYNSVSFNDKALHVTIQRYGGWAAICYWGDQEWNINERRLIEAYEAAVEFGDSGPDHLAGIEEIENTSREYLKYVPKPLVYNLHPGKQIESGDKKVLSIQSEINNMIEKLSNEKKLKI